MYGCQQHLITTDPDNRAVLEFICGEANKLTNCAIYYCRQVLFKAGKYVKKFELDKILKTNIHFRAMRSACAQQILHSVIESFKSYQALAKLYKSGKLRDKPRVPKYRKKGGMAVVSYPARWVKLKDGQLKFSLGNQVKAWFGIDHFLLPMPSNLDFKSINEFRFVPRNGCFYLEFVYKQSDIEPVQTSGNALGIDPGLNNWLTCVSTTGKSFIIDGRKIKSQNQWYNKQVAKIKKGKPQDYWDERLANITEKRNRQMRDNINKAAKFFINWCLRNQISTVVFGWNQRNKDGIKIGKKNNQEFVQIPTARLKNRVQQLCEQYGIKFIETEESYTSKASFLDQDFLPTLGAKPIREACPSGLGWKPSGKRIRRGLYRSANNELINADLRHACNILRKVATQLGVDLAEVGRAALNLPQRYRLDSLSSQYCKHHAARFQPA
ncbi:MULTISPECIES: RNA-guided endonuclease TnpB family protein [Moorena]|uniref:Transposase, IS605 OrfB family, central region n=1 Tax=Moorena producens 3L TaxID=489825 RepID=F4XXT0_9CYAN|nr:MULTISPECIES: RNA-guided endonuclease TnpB family protein [Moorena]NES81644.1 IS200/IS605 family element transposase accessory protein TnpB [Moorena sp. SIO2B7]EGJ30583.1 transposase, IS605 OrfB family, central region [Moorena producens 3L]NEP68279.1 IS200/IS605 family element transposase accessory protein TnpB [Moorena sp. SIO3A5]NEQ06802.1 IS200/IS605 family element transposase accessory protein TnpB [Moorena sp. SIO4E2]NER86390.1 IS200/IS605 family element transposase accessory protein T